MSREDGFTRKHIDLNRSACYDDINDYLAHCNRVGNQIQKSKKHKSRLNILEDLKKNTKKEEIAPQPTASNTKGQEAAFEGIFKEKDAFGNNESVKSKATMRNSKSGFYYNGGQSPKLPLSRKASVEGIAIKGQYKLKNTSDLIQNQEDLSRSLQEAGNESFKRQLQTDAAEKESMKTAKHSFKKGSTLEIGPQAKFESSSCSKIIKMPSFTKQNTKELRRNGSLMLAFGKGQGQDIVPLSKKVKVKGEKEPAAS
jgi:hypothetical protein